MEDFDALALAIFRRQFDENEIYKAFCRAIGIDKYDVGKTIDIPFLPISFFKSHQVITGRCDRPELVFESSGTTGINTSRHFVCDASLYENSLLEGFTQAYGSPENWTILALLPSYLERSGSSLVHMAKRLMEISNQAQSGFFLSDFDELADRLWELERAGKPTLLLGVTFGLLDFAERHPMHLQRTVVMETGGMKGRRVEWTREEVHDYLKSRFGVSVIHSEYGMTELLSQAYAKKDGLFRPAPTLRAMVREVNDPLSTVSTGTGALNFIDLANERSCSFIATEDLGVVNEDRTFRVTGRMDHSLLRGCSLMAV